MNTTIDYSKDDFFDINNQLFRRARNNLGKTSKSIDELDDDEKALGEKNLDIYGAELVNNLKQINYTFRQLEDYVFIPAKEPTKKELKALEARGSKATVEDIRKPPPPPPPSDGLEDKGFIITENPIHEFEEEDWKTYTPIDKSKNYRASELQKLFKYVMNEVEKIKILIEKQIKIEKPQIESDSSPSLKEKIYFLKDVLAPDADYIIYKLGEYGISVNIPDEIKEFEALPIDIDNEEYIPLDRRNGYKYSLEELQNKLGEVINEQERMKNIIRNQAEREGATSDENASPDLLDKIRYVEKVLDDEQRYIQSLINAIENEESIEPVSELPPLPPLPPPTISGEEASNLLPPLPPLPPPKPVSNDIIFPTNSSEDTTVIELMYNGTAPIGSLKKELRALGFRGKLASIKDWRDVRTVIDNYKSGNTISDIPIREEPLPNVPVSQPTEFIPTPDNSPFPDIIVDDQPIYLPDIPVYQPEEPLSLPNVPAYQPAPEPLSLPSIPNVPVYQQASKKEGPLNEYEKQMGNIDRFKNYLFINRFKIGEYDEEYIDNKIKEVMNELRLIDDTLKEQYRSEPSADLGIYSQGMKKLIQYKKSLDDEYEFLEKVKDQIPELLYRNYEFIKKSNYYNDEEYKRKFDEVNSEILEVNKRIKKELKKIGLELID